MVLKNLKIVTNDKIIENGYIIIEKSKISLIQSGDYIGNDEQIDFHGKILMPGFIDIHLHGSCGIDFMDAKDSDYKIIANSLYKEGVTTFLATTLTSDNKSLKRVCEAVKNAINEVPSLGGIHLEGPYINEKYKGAQNASYIRNPNINELNELIIYSNNNIRYISLAPEKEGAMDFIKFCKEHKIVCSAGHSDAGFDVIEKAIKYGLTNTTHTHNAMSPHHHRNPGIVTAAFYFDNLFTEFICDTIHVCPNTLKTSYKIIGPNRFIIITDALKIKNSNINEFDMFGLPAERKNGAAYLKTGPLAGSLLTMDKGLRNMNELINPGLVNLAKMTSYNAANALGFFDRGEIKVGKLADLVILNSDLTIDSVYKLGKKVV